jgi:hypothetical protein
MDSQNNLDTTGSLRINPLAELLIEIAQIKLNGSLRITNASHKIGIYFDAGETVFAVSNARQHRLFELLLKAGKITKEELLVIPEFTNDLALKEFLLQNRLFEKKEIDKFSSLQIAEILKTALAWRDGEWTFSPLVRIKGDIRFAVDLPNMLIEHARSQPAETVLRKFNNPRESLRVKSAMPANLNLSPAESFVFSRFDQSASTIEGIQTLSGLPESETIKIIYALGLGGLLTRETWNAAFSERKISAILSARLALKKEETAVAVESQTAAMITPLTDSEVEKATEEIAPVEKHLSLEEYLLRVEKASNFYEIFALAPDAAVSEIKRTYFGLAKRFHPDLFHKEADAELLQKIQTTFTRVAHAYDTLKTESSREVYDFKMRKELAEMKAAQSSGMTHEELDLQKQTVQAAENFETGFDLLMDGNYNAAQPFLARAVHFDNNNAYYHACYGKALSADNKQRHKAEAELQTAIKLESQNAEYRIMLAEFFIQFNLLKRAEGELNRLLTNHPNNREARSLLDSLPKK